ncbi:hypothetical protein SSX86_006083 [Deinandra increscens subsp. villosa]|uniref:Mediator complex subunit 15 KIX domain-containing protein n=1 Tax=Deinandra increscens subsp. villosa TaxID=3103831 RepID=A0AAP0HAF7_9ASTR
MDTSNCRPTQGARGAAGDPTMESGDWRAQLQREMTVNKIMDTLKKHLPFPRHERLQELNKIAKRVEEEIYTAATSQSEYSRKICFMMLTMETRLQNPKLDSMLSNSLPFDLIAQTGNRNGRDWQQEVYQKIKAMKYQYLLDIRRTQGASGAVGDPDMKSGDWRSEYSRKICFMMLTIETRLQTPLVDSVKSNSAASYNSLHHSVPFDSIARIDNPNGRDWQQEVYQKIKAMKDLYLLDLRRIQDARDSVADPIMASVDWRATQSAGGAIGDPILESVDWKAQLQAESRQRIVNKILETLKRHLPFSGPEGLQELMKIALTFEEKIYSTATSQSDYLRKISLKMLTMETRPQNPMSDPIMASVDWRPTQSAGGAIGDPILESVDWRVQLKVDSRPRIVNKILDTLKRHLPFSGPEGLQELMNIASMFEEKIYTTATSQSDYLRKISLKMLTVETRPQNPMSDPIMASFDWSPTQSAGGAIGGDPILESVDWRAHLHADSRQRIVNKILDTLKRHLPFSGTDGLQELMNIALRFEEKIYTAATSQSDYLREISLKMLAVETRSQNPMSDPMQSNYAASSVNP